MPPVVLPERLQRLPAAMRRDSPTLAFTPGMPAVNYFPLPLWRRLIDNVLREDGSALLELWRSRGRSFAARGYRSSSGALPGHPVRYPADRHHRRRAGRRQLMRLATDQPGRQRVAGRTGVPGRGVAFSGRDCGSEEWLSTMKGCVLPTASRSRPGSFSPLLHTSIPVGAS